MFFVLTISMDIVSFKKCFINESSYNKYIELFKDKEFIDFNIKTPGFQKHHIIPRAAFKNNIDNSASNVVKLTAYEHLKAHVILAKNLKNSALKNKMCYALAQMTKYKSVNLSDEQLQECAALIEQGNKYHSQRLKNYYNNLSEEERQLKYCGEHWKETHKNNNSPEQIERRREKYKQHTKEQKESIAKKQHMTKLKNNSYKSAAEKWKKTITEKNYDWSKIQKEASSKRTYEAAHAGEIAAKLKYINMTDEEKEILNKKKGQGGKNLWQKLRSNEDEHKKYLNKMRVTRRAKKDYPDIICDQFPGEIFQLYADLANKIGQGCNSSHIKRVCMLNAQSPIKKYAYKGYICYYMQ